MSDDTPCSGPCRHKKPNPAEISAGAALLGLALGSMVGCAPEIVQPLYGTVADDDDSAVVDDDDSVVDDDDVEPESSYCLSAVPESDVLAAVYGGPKVPPGFWSDTAQNAVWWDPCSASVSDTEAAAAQQYPSGTVAASSSTTWYHEAEVVLETGNSARYRNTRCDYWDGAVVAAPLPVPGWTELQELAGYLWWTDNHNFGGAHIVGGWGTVGDATNFFELCHVTTVYGDWGLNDEISVWSQSFGIGQFDGSVWFEEPQLEGVIVGNLN